MQLEEYLNHFSLHTGFLLCNIRELNRGSVKYSSGLISMT